MISVEEATLKLMENVSVSSEVDSVDLEHAAGRILAKEIYAERDAPPFDRVMMDGFALCSNGSLGKSYQIEGIALAGHAPSTLKDQSNCIEVTTGCPLPPGCNTIIPIECCSIEEDRIHISQGISIEPGKYIHTQASDGKTGRIVLKKGIKIGPPEVAILATEGIQKIEVSRLPKVSLLTTGDEIVISGNPPSQFQIRGSHQETLKSLFKSAIGINLATDHAMDDEEDIYTKLNELLLNSDILLITGGVSKGKKDFIPKILADLGVSKLFHAVAQRPGKPIWVGQKGEKLVFGLPGNPISALTCARRYVIAAIEKWLGKAASVPLSIPVDGNFRPDDSFTLFIPVLEEAGSFKSSPFSTSGSLHHLAQTIGFIEVPPVKSPTQLFNFYPWY